MVCLAGAQLVPLVGLVMLLSSAPLLVKSVDCPADSVVVSGNGSLVFRPLSSGADNIDPTNNPGAIGGWYSLAAGFVDVVRSGTLPYDQIKDGLTSLGVPCSFQQNCSTDSPSQDFDPVALLRSFATWWAGIIAVCILGGVLAVSFLVCGCCFWCCRCCGNCGGGKTQKISDHMDCKSFTFTIILLLFTLLLLISVVFAFFSNEQTFRSIDNLQESITIVTNTAAGFIGDTIVELEELLCQLAAPMDSITTTVIDEARGFNATLESEIDQVGDEVFGILRNLDNLTAGINETVDVLTAVNSSTMALTMSFMALQNSLNTTSTQVSMLIADCENQGTVQPLCDMIPRPQQFQTQADFANLPDVSGELGDVKNAISDVNLDQLISEGEQQFDDITRSISTTVDENLGNVVNQLENVTSTALNSVGDITETIRVYLNTSQVSNCPPLTEVFNDVQFDINSLLSDSNSFDLSGGLRRKRQAGSSQTLNIGYVQQCVIDQSFDVVRQYDVYRYAFGIVICSISLITILFVLFGVLFGMIGFRKGVDPEERSGLSHCGGILLLVGVGLTFLFGFLLLVFSAVVFFFGANAQKLCQALEGPDYPLFAELIDDQEFWGGSLAGQLFQATNPNATDAVLSISVALRNCQEDMALYSALNLSNLIPTGNISTQIESLVNLDEVENLVDGLIEGAAGSFNFTNTSFLPENAQTAINMFVDSDVAGINITAYTDQLNQALLAFDIDQSIGQLNNISVQLTMVGQTDLATRVDAIVQGLEMIRDTQIPTIQNQTTTLSNDVSQLDTVINTTVMDVSRLLRTTDELIANITGQTLNDFLDNNVRATISRTIGYVNDYIAHLDAAVERDVSRCQPLWAVYTTMHNSVCGVFLDGLNGFWWSLGFCSILFIPVIIFSVITSTCYLRKKSGDQLDSYTDYPMKDVR